MTQALFIGRFQPFHNGHLDVVKQILSENDKALIVIGSAELNHTFANPLTIEERTEIISKTLEAEGISKEKYELFPISDLNDCENWASYVDKQIPEYQKIYTGSSIVKRCYSKKHDLIVPIQKNLEISASEVREGMAKDKNWESLVPKTVEKLLKKWDVIDRIKSTHLNP
jgi:nicotinamide-nucleotide adenylyltransferase